MLWCTHGWLPLLPDLAGLLKALYPITPSCECVFFVAESFLGSSFSSYLQTLMLSPCLVGNLCQLIFAEGFASLLGTLSNLKSGLASAWTFRNF